LGWVEGRNARIDIRWPAADYDRIRKYVAELVALVPDVILATGSTIMSPLLQATRTIPIVFTAPGPERTTLLVRASCASRGHSRAPSLEVKHSWRKISAGVTLLRWSLSHRHPPKAAVGDGNDPTHRLPDRTAVSEIRARGPEQIAICASSP
jgi:hypothetical protein